MLDEKVITQTILRAYHEKFNVSIDSDVVIGGAGPAGLAAAFYAAKSGLKVVVIDKSLATGGGIWGGGMGMNEAVVDREALIVLDDIGVSYRDAGNGLFTVDSCELASGLCLAAVRAGARILNLMIIEDVCVRDDRVAGVAVNRTLISGALPVDPVVIFAKAIVDATGHKAALVTCLHERGCIKGRSVSEMPLREGVMNAEDGERFVIDRTEEVYPGLWVAGMSVAAVFGGPRMGPIFKGMLLSGKRVANEILKKAENLDL